MTLGVCSKNINFLAYQTPSLTLRHVQEISTPAEDMVTHTRRIATSTANAIVNIYCMEKTSSVPTLIQTLATSSENPCNQSLSDKCSAVVLLSARTAPNRSDSASTIGCSGLAKISSKMPMTCGTLLLCPQQPSAAVPCFVNHCSDIPQ
ncbi:unnamed protein product [Ceratitis capitata]|uniref:(Mediterranean fruit fly) hypothetical protein n=1 Tax=Ceratitis capitata TaxID=7213 RepID=A0A811V7P0_CERCA|nr:unnamed protein product [Ceratitis capitata]